MRTVKILLSILVVVLLLAGAVGCGSDESTEEAGTYTASVDRGNLVVNISAAGNLAFTQMEELAVDLFFQQGTVEEVLVETGDSVTEGQELVKLDTGEWNDELVALEKSLISAERILDEKEDALYQAQRQVSAKESSVQDAKRQVESKELAVRQAELDVRSANNTLLQIDEINKIQERVDKAQEAVTFLTNVYEGVFGGWIISSYDFTAISQLKSNAEVALADAQEDLAAILADAGMSSTSDVALQIENKLLQIERTNRQLEDAQLAVLDAEEAVSDAEYAVEEAKEAVEDAELAVSDARLDISDITYDLEQAKQMSPVITAPFDGFVTKVNVEGGDEVMKGTVAVQIANPDKFEAEILVSETDILQVGVGTIATVMADAIAGVSYPAEVTQISPTATISSGVVNYTVKVVLSDLEEMAQNMQSSMGIGKSDNITSDGEFSPPSWSGNMTGDGQFKRPDRTDLPEGIELPEGFEMSEGGFRGMTSRITETKYDLREGMSVTVNLIVSSETDVLLVPYTAITTIGGQSYVNVQLENGETEQRTVTTGSTNYSYIAILDGLSEGEIVVVPEGTIVNSGGSFGFPGGGFMVPMGGR